MEHELLMESDLDYAAFCLFWRPFDFGDPGTELTARYPDYAPAAIEAALVRARLLRRAVDSAQSLGAGGPPKWEVVLDYLRRAAPGASDAAYGCAGDKAFFLLWR